MLRKKIDSNIRIKVPEKLEPLFRGAGRHTYIYGGRGSGKSHGVAQYCLFRAAQAPIKVLCTRELQNSIADSVHALLSKKIASMGLQGFFTIYKDRIVGENGSVFIFKGIHNNVGEIKSMEDISIAWCEESQTISRESIDVLTPTIRAPGSVIIYTFNPYKDSDPVFMDMMNAEEDDLVIRMNHGDNPWFPEELRLEMERDRRNDYSKYLWVWEGECLGISDAQIFRGKYEVAEFDTPPNAEFHFGVDWGFSNDPVALIRSFIIGNTLYIDQCAGEVGCDIVETPALFDRVEGASIYPVYADSSRPETISHMRSRGYNVISTKKGAIEDGIEFLRSFSRIVIHPRCSAVAEEFDLYQYKVDRQTGEILREPMDKYNHFIDALRYSMTTVMWASSNGKVYEQFTASCICPDERPAGTVYFGTLFLPGKILWVAACVAGGRIMILDSFQQKMIDFVKARERYPGCEYVWMPFATLKDIQQNYVGDCTEAGVEPAVPGVLPAEGEGTKLVNDLFTRGALSVMEGAWILISCLNERVFLADGKIERSSSEQDNARFCRLFEYLVWRIKGRLLNE